MWPVARGFHADPAERRNTVKARLRMMRTKQDRARRAFGSAVVSLILAGTAACDSVSDPAEQTREERDERPVAVQLNPGQPQLASAAEVAMLRTIGVADTPPDVPAGTLQSASSAAAASCSIAFADYIGLLILPDQAEHTFASAPFYIQGCGSGWVHVKENDPARYGAAWGSSYGHYHLMYERGTYCITGGGDAGVRIGGVCVKVTPENEPRYLGTHTGTQWLRIYVYKSGVAEMTFDLKSIRVLPSQAIKLYFRTTGGAWYHWSSLGVGTWNLAPYAGSIREVLIRGAGTSPSPYFIDNIGVAVI
jgi:hypothetical protein